MKHYKNGLFIFRRDLRLNDNTGLNQALEDCDNVIGVFINDPAFDYGDKRQHAKAFLLSALAAVDDALIAKRSRLHLLSGTPSKALVSFIKKHGIDSVYVNANYSAAGTQRDQAIEALCDQLGIDFHAADDQLLFTPGSILNLQEKPYKVFTAFYKACLRYNIARPSKLAKGDFATLDDSHFDADALSKQWQVDCANTFNMKTLISETVKSLGDKANYIDERDIPSLGGTTQLSSHLRFGTISPRQAYNYIEASLGPDSPILRQLYWRDFFHHIGWHFPHVFTSAFREAYNDIPWSQDEAAFIQWCTGNTGFPIVDAGMRELNETGYMHNRVRMITASFLTKDLHIDWRWGEKYFAEHLIDYDVAVNNGNWQWCASTGCDAQPYFRIFNPWRQQLRFDPECHYIKQWVPELQALTPKAIHELEKTGGTDQYPAPMVNHSIAAAHAKSLFKFDTKTAPEQHALI